MQTDNRILKPAMKVFIRSAKSEDQVAIRNLVRVARLNPMKLHWRDFLVAEDRGVVVGVAQIRPHNDGSRELASLAVQAAYQGRGIGRALVQTLLCRGDEDLYLFCAGEMADFYRHYGFVVIGGRHLPVSMRPMYGLGMAVTRLISLFRPDVGQITAMRLAR